MLKQIDNPPQEQIIVHHFLCIALGSRSFLHPYIEECYLQNEWDYYEVYQRSDFKGNPLFSMYTTKNEEKIRQVAGIVEWCDQNEQFSHVDHLIKKGYKFAYHYFQQNKLIDFEQFMRSYARKKKRQPVKEVELIYHNVVLWYLCVRENKPFNTNNIAWQSFQGILCTSINEIKVQKSMFSKEMVNKHRDEIDELYCKYNIPKNTSFDFDSLGGFIEYLISSNIKKIYNTNPYCHANKAEQQVFQNTPIKFIGAIGGWLKTLKIQELDATEQIPFTKAELDLVFLELLYAQKYNYINKDDQDLFFISCLYLKCLSSLYRETKQLYLDQSKDDHYFEIKSKEAQIKKKELDLHRKKQEWQVVHKRQQEEIEGLTQELRETKAKIRQLEQQIAMMEDHSVEVHSLRNFMYQEEQAVSMENKEPSFKIMKDFIKSKQIVIFGGSPNWQQKLKEHFSSVEFIDVDEKNREISRIQRVDAVFINTAVFAHAFYKKIIKELSKCDTKTPLYYINGQSNIEKTTSEMYKWLTQ